MKKILAQAHQFLKEEDGQSTAEYVLILAIVVMVVIKFKSVFVGRIETATQGLGTGIDSVINDLNSGNF